MNMLLGLILLSPHLFTIQGVDTKMQTLALLTHPGHWQIVNDGVMGGHSQSELSETLGPDQQYMLRFDGHVSLANNGGFASVSRTLSQEEQQLLSETDPRHISLTAIGDGRRYQLRLKVLKQGEIIHYKAGFDTQVDTLAHWSFSPDDFIETFHGEDYPERPLPDFTQLAALGLLIGDGQEGEFELLLAGLSIEH
ncbi:CIA30 family protein [Shewanella sp. JBTF-M18]|uniref:CIA30 family protein n=2 Tax=Shewanella insulae TaxID=2681496 RepID=A0A6L7HTM7_9GAMM|nr:CIA30 family protein [Shewanella insulae]